MNWLARWLCVGDRPLARDHVTRLDGTSRPSTMGFRLVTHMTDLHCLPMPRIMAVYLPKQMSPSPQCPIIVICESVPMLDKGHTSNAANQRATISSHRHLPPLRCSPNPDPDSKGKTWNLNLDHTDGRAPCRRSSVRRWTFFNPIWASCVISPPTSTLHLVVSISFRMLYAIVPSCIPPLSEIQLIYHSPILPPSNNLKLYLRNPSQAIPNKVPHAYNTSFFQPVS